MIKQVSWWRSHTWYKSYYLPAVHHLRIRMLYFFRVLFISIIAHCTSFIKLFSNSSPNFYFPHFIAPQYKAARPPHYRLLGYYALSGSNCCTRALVAVTVVASSLCSARNLNNISNCFKWQGEKMYISVFFVMTIFLSNHTSKIILGIRR